MKVIELHTKEEMLKSYSLLTEAYPSLSLTQYSQELDKMIRNEYFQIALIDADEFIALTGIWIGTKLWSGKYLELDNIIISSKQRNKGFGKLLFEYAESIAKTNNCTLMALDTYSDNFEAQKFFYKQDFIPRGFHFIKILNKNKIR